MASLRDIRRRIESVKSTQKITRAMKMVAAAKLRRAQDAIVMARPYANSMRHLVTQVAQRSRGGAHPLLREREENRIALVVVTSDRGLCGAFNSNILNEVARLTTGRFEGKQISLTAIGRKGVEILRRRAYTIDTARSHVLDGSAMHAASEIVEPLVDRFGAGQIDAVYVLYNEFKSAISQRVTLERLLPFQPGETVEQAVTDYLYEPSQEEVLEILLKRELQIQMHRILHESAASEHGARMTAMDSATNNARDVIQQLTLQYNRVRQDAITAEMLEIIGGAEAL